MRTTGLVLVTGEVSTQATTDHSCSKILEAISEVFDLRRAAITQAVSSANAGALTRAS